MAVDTGTVQVVMPAMGDSVSEGTVLEWHRREGESIDADQTLVEISTDKVDAEVPAPVSGTVVKIHAAEGDTVAVGALLAEIAPGDAGGSASNGAPGAPGAPGVSGESRGDGAVAAPQEPPVSGESPPTSTSEQVSGASTEAQGVAAEQSAAGQTIDIVTPTG